MIKLFLISVLLLLFNNYSECKNYTNPDDTVLVEIKMDNFSFEPSKIEIPAGKIVKFKFTNIGTAKHEFIAGHNITEEKDGYKEDLFDNVDLQKYKNEKLIKNESEESNGGKIILNPEETGSLIFKLPESKKGEWDMGCFINIGGGTHYQMGMKGKIIIK